MRDKHMTSLEEFFENLRAPLRSSLESLIAEHHGLKIWIGVDVQYRHMLEDRIVVGHLTTRTALIYNSFQIDEVLEKIEQEVQLRNANYLRNASPFALDSVECAVMHVARYNPTIGGTYLELPAFLARKKCIVNVKKTDNRCFRYSILASLVALQGSHNRAWSYEAYFRPNHRDEIQ